MISTYFGNFKMSGCFLSKNDMSVISFQSFMSCKQLNTIISASFIMGIIFISEFYSIFLNETKIIIRLNFIQVMGIFLSQLYEGALNLELIIIADYSLVSIQKSM